MSTLIVRRRKKSGEGPEKVYRFAMESGHFTVGSSRKADLRLPRSSAESIEGIFEVGPEGWTYHSFAVTQDPKEIVIPIEGRKPVLIGDFELDSEVLVEKSRFSEAPSKATEGLNQQVILVLRKDHLVTSATGVPNTTQKVDVLGELLEIPCNLNPQWTTSQIGSYTIRQRSIATDDAKTYRMPLKELMPASKSDRAAAGALLLTFVLGLFSSWMAPSSKEVVAEMEPPKVTAPVLVKLMPPKPAPAQPQEPTNTGKVASGSLDRIKSLSAKISNKAGLFLEKSAQISATGPNGNLRAPAMGVSKLGGSNTNWTAMAGSKVSGSVSGGLSGGSGTGQLNAGAIGNSGVGLLEDEGEVSTGLDREVIAALIRKNIGHILYCYERSLSANPNLFGKVSVKFTIGSSGRVETQKIGESTLRDGRVESCILDKISQWKFPEPKGGVQVVVTYPFLFKTTN